MSVKEFEKFADPIEPKKYKAEVKSYDPETDEPIILTEEFEDWVFEGELVCPIQDVINDWAYTKFDKRSFKINYIKEI